MDICQTKTGIKLIVTVETDTKNTDDTSDFIVEHYFNNGEIFVTRTCSQFSFELNNSCNLNKYRKTNSQRQKIINIHCPEKDNVSIKRTPSMY